jgi:serine/threonine-protein kinase
VTNASVASDSSSIISGIGQWGGGAMQIDFSIMYQHATSSTPMVTFSIGDTGDSDSTSVPVPTGGALEGETGYTCTGGGDCHLIVVNDSTQQLFELWSVSSVSGTTGSAQQETVWDLTKHYPPAGRGPGCSSADAAGLAIMPGLIGLRETKAGAIKHALRFILPNAKIRSGSAWAAPASHGTSSTSSSSGPAYGMRLRLHASFDASKISSPGGKAVVQALKTYGMLLADGGNDIFTAESDYLEQKIDGTTWGTTLQSNDLASIQPSDFDVLDYTTPLGSGDDCKPNSFF